MKAAYAQQAALTDGARRADTEGMRRAHFAAVLVLLCASAGAETVMVAVGRGGPPPEDEKAEKFYLSAVEDGIMEEFFLADSIVFNDGGHPSRTERLDVMRRAREGGATRLLFVETTFAEAPAAAGPARTPSGERPDPAAPGAEAGKPAPLPERLAYAYYHVAEQKLLLGGEVDAKTAWRGGEISPEKYCADLGRRIARLVLAGGGIGKTR